MATSRSSFTDAAFQLEVFVNAEFNQKSSWVGKGAGCTWVLYQVERCKRFKFKGDDVWSLLRGERKRVEEFVNGGVCECRRRRRK
jgi:hypothetical protein